MIEVNCDVCGSDEAELLLALQGSEYRRCIHCGSIFAKWIPDDYETVNETAFAADLSFSASKLRRANSAYQRKLHRFDAYRKTNRFVEIGCSAGSLLVSARNMGWQVQGVDICEASTDFARTQHSLDVHTGTIETAGYEAESVDVVFSNATLEHVRHPLSTVQESARILRPGGVFYADTVNWDSYTREILGANWALISPIHHLHLFTPANVLSLCAAAGLNHLKTWTTGARVEANAQGSNFHTPWYLKLCKGPLSMMTRFNNKGDSIEFLALKPLHGEAAALSS